MIAISFLARLLEVLVAIIISGMALLALVYIASWVTIGVIEALGYNNSRVAEWIKSKLPKRKVKRKK